MLTNHGEKPIETVTTDDLVWDGEQWVTHEGVIYKGIKEVITYQGLTATIDHTVYLDTGGYAPLASAIVFGFNLIDSTSESNSSAETQLEPREAKVYDIRNAGPNHRYTVSGKLVHNCGYGGSVGALKAFGADKMGLTEDEMLSIVNNWRASSPRIVQLWWDVDRAVKTAIAEGTTQQTHGLLFKVQKGILFIKLPSGRSLAYVKPRLIDGKITYEGVSSNKGWARLESYGPKFVENITQAISRDLLLNAMRKVGPDARICMHIHDELVIEAGDELTLDEVCKRMAEIPEWAEGLLLRADGYETKFYLKD